MINLGMKRIVKETLFQGIFWIVTLMLFGLIAFKLIIYVKG
jgi:hypothetical protein